jgi:hypothetical protein
LRQDQERNDAAVLAYQLDEAAAQGWTDYANADHKATTPAATTDDNDEHDNDDDNDDDDNGNNDIVNGC